MAPPRTQRVVDPRHRRRGHRRARSPDPPGPQRDPGGRTRAHGLGILRHREDVPERAPPNRLVVRDPAGDDERLVEADHSPRQIEDDVEGGRGVDDRRDEVPFARELVQASAQLLLESAALQREPRRGEDYTSTNPGRS